MARKNTGQGGQLQAKGDGPDAGDHGSPQKLSQPGGGLKGSSHDLRQACAGEQGERQ